MKGTGLSMFVSEQSNEANGDGGTSTSSAEASDRELIATINDSSFQLKIFWDAEYEWEANMIGKNWCAACLEENCAQGSVVLDLCDEHDLRQRWTATTQYEDDPENGGGEILRMSTEINPNVCLSYKNPQRLNVKECRTNAGAYQRVELEPQQRRSSSSSSSSSSSTGNEDEDITVVIVRAGDDCVSTTGTPSRNDRLTATSCDVAERNNALRWETGVFGRRPEFFETLTPTRSPTLRPTTKPSSDPTNDPTPSPTTNPTPSPTNDPTPIPTTNPTSSPTNDSTLSPTREPNFDAALANTTPSPTWILTIDPNPPDVSLRPTISPVKRPTPAPSRRPTTVASVVPSRSSSDDDAVYVGASLQLRLYWEEGYEWSGFTVRRNLCAQCIDVGCQSGWVFLQECDATVPEQRFTVTANDQIASEKGVPRNCLSYTGGRKIKAEQCTPDRDYYQKWSIDQDGDGGDLGVSANEDVSLPVDLGVVRIRPPDDANKCLTSWLEPDVNQCLNLIPCDAAEEKRAARWVLVLHKYAVDPPEIHDDDETSSFDTNNGFVNDRDVCEKKGKDGSCPCYPLDDDWYCPGDDSPWDLSSATVNNVASDELYGACDRTKFPRCRDPDQKLCPMRKPRLDRWHGDDREDLHYYVDYDCVKCVPRTENCSKCSPGVWCEGIGRCVTQGRLADWCKRTWPEFDYKNNEQQNSEVVDRVDRKSVV